MSANNQAPEGNGSGLTKAFGKIVEVFIGPILIPVLLWLYTPTEVKSHFQDWFNTFSRPFVAVAIFAFICGILVTFLWRLRSALLRVSSVAATFLCLLFVLALNLHPPHADVYPDTLLISPPASGDLTGRTNSWLELKTELQDKLNHYIPQKTINVEFKELATTAAQLTALESPTNAFVAFLGSGAAVTAALDPRYHFLPFFVLCDTNGVNLKYKAVWIVNGGNPVSKLCSDWPSFAAVLRANKTIPIGLGDDTSTSSYRIPKLALNAIDLKPKILQYPTQGAVIQAVANNEIIGACVASDALDRVKMTVRTRVKTLEWGSTINQAYTNSFPSTCIGWRNDLAVPVQLCIESTLSQHHWKTNDFELGTAYRLADSDNNPLQTSGFGTIDDFLQLWLNAIQIKEMYDVAFPPEAKK